MAKTEHYYTQFFPDCFYHVYNRTVDRKPMFTKEKNRVYFLKKYDKYLSPLVTTYSYALCGNHFHFGIKIKPLKDLMAFANQGPGDLRYLTNFENLSNQSPSNQPQPQTGLGRFKTVHALVARQFQTFFLSYAKAFNKQEDRVGTLFQRPFKRCAVNTEGKLVRMIFYHHANPQRHRLCADFRDYPWTSFPRHLSNRPSILPRKEVFNLLGGREQFIEYHEQESEQLKDDDDWLIED